MLVGILFVSKLCVNNVDCDPKEYCDQMLCMVKKPIIIVCEENNECFMDKCKDMG